MFELQRFVFPNDKFNLPRDMYFRYQDEKVINDMYNDHFLMFPGALIESNTFYNSFSLQKWKDNTIIDDLYLSLSGKGELIVRVLSVYFGRSYEILASQKISLNGVSYIEIPDFRKKDPGILYFELQATSETRINGGGYFTTTEPIRNVNLGVVITHFNRASQINRSIKRIESELLNDSKFINNITLTIIDNSKNCGIKSRDNITIIENDNFGGSGGFTRGLMMLEDSHSHTHCLFMDDDASCEVESIRRAYHILSYSIQDNLAIAGALLSDSEPSRLIEKGALFDNFCKPLKSGLNMLDPFMLVESEFNDKEPNYGGWWFFAFAINSVKYHPIPFFVKGDDISFSLANNFKLLTMNGIASLGENFSIKSGALPLYLDLRSHLVHQIFFLNKSKLRLIGTTLRFFLNALLSHNYGTANAVCQAIDDFMRGPDFFEENIDMQSRLTMTKSWAKDEQLIPTCRANYNIAYRGGHESRLRRVFRWITLNGLLLPNIFLINDRIVFQEKNFSAAFNEVFRFKNIYYEHTPSMKGYIAKQDKFKAIKCLKQYIYLTLKFYMKFSSIRKKYKTKLPKLMRRNFWDKVYKTG